MTKIYTFNVRTKNTLWISDAKTGQKIRTVSVDGEIISNPNVSGDIGYISVKKGNVTKVYVYNLRNGSIIKINSL
jgi:hypothetical protein